ncbi:hypothetical protein C2G38_2138637 [Gigaspora rosea]|uniref:SAP domain-containing protein n=1 Tax=Gigaspora rosea TaxID=44941 RepID=A0A397VT33_9GLOM|nr:hypothetical protein C2G38_2138637 [Gigaspora rosea]
MIWKNLRTRGLKLLCNGEGLSEAGAKQDLIERLAERVVNKSKRKERTDDSGQSNNVWRENDIGLGSRVFEKNFEKGTRVDEGYARTQEWGSSDLQFLALERSFKKSIQATLEKAVGEIKRSVQVMHSVEESKYWPREKFGKASDKFEYDEWCKVGRLIDSALVNRDWGMIEKVRDVAATRAFTLRVAKKDWNMVAGIRDPLDDDPMEVFFQEKLASARQSAKNSRSRWDEKSEVSDAFFSNGLRGIGGVPHNPLVQWLMPSPQYFQPGQPSFIPGGNPTYGNMLPYPSTYQHRYESQRRLWVRPWAGQGSSRPYIPNGPRRWSGNPGIVCFICEERVILRGTARRKD